MNFFIIFFLIASILSFLVLRYLKIKNQSKCPYCSKEMLLCGFEPNQRWECRNKDCEVNK